MVVDVQVETEATAVLTLSACERAEGFAIDMTGQRKVI
jgi:hypothetical protein